MMDELSPTGDSIPSAAITSGTCQTKVGAIYERAICSGDGPVANRRIAGSLKLPWYTPVTSGYPHSRDVRWERTISAAT
jgi:hypothetical protein